MRRTRGRDERRNLNGAKRFWVPHDLYNRHKERTVLCQFVLRRNRAHVGPNPPPQIARPSMDVCLLQRFGATASIKLLHRPVESAAGLSHSPIWAHAAWRQRRLPTLSGRRRGATNVMTRAGRPHTNASRCLLHVRDHMRPMRQYGRSDGSRSMNHVRRHGRRSLRIPRCRPRRMRKRPVPDPATAIGGEVPRVAILDVSVLVTDLRNLQIGHYLLLG